MFAYYCLQLRQVFTLLSSQIRLHPHTKVQLDEVSANRGETFDSGI